jgi:Putative zinc-finger
MDAMSRDNCAAVRTALGAYVIAALEPAERSEVESHLHTCPDCRIELAQLAVLPGLLGRLRAGNVAAEWPAPATGMVERALAEVVRRRRGARRRVVAVAAAAAVALSGGVVAAVSAAADRGDTPWSAPAASAGLVAAATDPVTHISATVRMIPSDSGTVLALSLHGVRPGQSYERCRLVAVSRSGERDTAASWVASYLGQVDVRGQTALRGAELTALEVVAVDGTRLVTVPVT